MRKLVIFAEPNKTPMYPEEIVQPMRDELTAVGFKQVNDVEKKRKSMPVEPPWLW